MIREKRATLALFLVLCSLLVTLTNIVAVRAAEDYWITLEPMPTAETGLGAAVVDGKIYVMGSKVNYVYDPATDTWKTREPMPTPRGAGAIAVYQNKIFVIGGVLADGSSSNANEVYDPLTETWESREQMPTNRTQLESNVVNGKLYLMGGRTGDQKTTVATNEVYDLATDSWTTKEPLPYPVVQYASAEVNGKIHVIGGQNEFHGQYEPLNTDHNQIYEPETDTWSLGAPLPTVVWNAAAGATTGINAPKRIYVIGGTPDGGLEGTDITQVYDPENDVWTYGASMPTARAWLAVAVVDDLLYALGGTPGLMLHPVKANEQYIPIGYIPEFPSWTPLLITLVAVVAVTVIYRRRLPKKRKAKF